MHLIGVFDAPSGPLSFVVVLTRPLTSPFALGADGVLLAAVVAYAVGSRRHARGATGHEAASVGEWPVWRAAAFVGGAVLLFAAVGSGLARYGERPSVLVVQHVLLMMAAPPLLVVGRPLRAWRAPRRRATDTTTRPTCRMLWAAQGVVSWPLYYGSMAAFFLTPLLGDSVRAPALLDLVDCWFVAVGLLFFSGFGGRTRDGAARSFGFRIAALLAGAPIETAVGIALVLWPRPVIAGTALAATHTAGLVLWIASMVASGAVLGAVLVQWVLDDTRRGAEIDLLLEGSTTGGETTTVHGAGIPGAGIPGAGIPGVGITTSR